MMMERLISVLKDEDGATMVEYAIMVAMIATVCITAVASLGTSTNELFVVEGLP